jgi:glycosyltransferase involved in cell wall biosynthesis
MSAPAAARAPLRAAIVIPAYQAAGTIASVIEGALALDPKVPVIVVDDGSTDGTGAELDPFTYRMRARCWHGRNRGKGAALLTGFAAARNTGATHAVTIDADGQHDPADVPRLLAAAEREPAAIVLGVRDLVGPGFRRWKSRLLRAHSNVWMRLATGRRLADTQTGFRVYPLGPLAEIERAGLRASRYDFELEVLIEAARRGVPFAEVPIACAYPPGAGSRFRAVRDSLLCVRVWLRALLGRRRPPPA